MMFERKLFVGILIFLPLLVATQLLQTEKNELKITKDDSFIRSKRSLVNLYLVISCGTDCHPLLYNNYGCYCGFYGSGNAIDGIDSCCKAHDRCYEITNCLPLIIYFVPYFWICYNNKPYCSFNGNNTCSRQLCECDTAFVNCLRQYPCPTKKLKCPSWRFWK